MIKTLKDIFNFFYRPATGDTIRFFTERPLAIKLLGKKLGLTLEIGCGLGIYTKYLSKNASRLVALDIQEEYLSKVKKIYLKKNNVSFVQADAQMLPFLNSTFAMVVCTQVLEHVKNDLKVIEEISRVLKNNGRFILSVPVPPSPVEDNSFDLYDSHMREGYYFEDIERILKNKNFKIVIHKYYFFIWSRWAFKLIALFEKYFIIRPPGIFIFILCQIDKLFSLILNIKPYGLIIDTRKI